MSSKYFGQSLKVCKIHIQGLPTIGGPQEDCKESV